MSDELTLTDQLIATGVAGAMLSQALVNLLNEKRVITSEDRDMLFDLALVSLESSSLNHAITQEARRQLAAMHKA